MNIKNLIPLFFLCLTLFLTGCGKKENKKLAGNYYRLAINYIESSDGRLQNVKQSLDCLDKAIEYSPEPSYFALKGTLLLKLGNVDEADECFQKVLSGNIDPKVKSDVLNNYACLLAEIGRVKEACSIWEKLKESKHYLTPEVALFNQGKLLVLNGDILKAKNKLYEAVQYAPDYIDAHYYLAIVADKYLKDSRLARIEAETVLSLEPLHIGARKLVSLITKREMADKQYKF